MLINNLELQDAKLFTCTRHGDSRGWFAETFKMDELEGHIFAPFIFECTSFSANTNTIRGLHAQNDTRAQSKLVSVIQGSIMDVIVDARVNSPTYGKSCSVHLSSNTTQHLYVPRGFYHGFITLEPNTQIQYKLDNYYNPAAECGVSYDDPTLNIDWGIVTNVTQSIRDQIHPSWEKAYKFS